MMVSATKHTELQRIEAATADLLCDWSSFFHNKVHPIHEHAVWINDDYHVLFWPEEAKIFSSLRGWKADEKAVAENASASNRRQDTRKLKIDRAFWSQWSIAVGLL